jgi:hypothetical protein
MGETLTIRLSQDLSRWLEKVSRETGVPASSSENSSSGPVEIRARAHG